jgi:NADPH:quinone reductase-like Zn-dependent oxidoreductase
MIKLAVSEGMEIINVVQRQDQADSLCNRLKANHVVVVTGPNDVAGLDALKSNIVQLGARVAFDAVGGAMTGALLNVMPEKGVVYVYGGLDGSDLSGFDPKDLVSGRKQLKSFCYDKWLQEGGPRAMMYRLHSAVPKVKSGLKPGGWSSTEFVDTTAEHAHSDLVDVLHGSATNKKLRIRFTV